MSPLYPRDFGRRVDRLWDQRHSTPQAAQAPPTERVGCPGCSGAAPTAPRGSQYRGKGIFRRLWRCGACGHEWTTQLTPEGAR